MQRWSLLPTQHTFLLLFSVLTTIKKEQLGPVAPLYAYFGVSISNFVRISTLIWIFTPKFTFQKKNIKKKTIFLIDCDVVSIWSIESNFISNTNIGQMWKNYSGIVICLKYFFKTINVNFNFWNNSFLGFSFRNIGSWSEK